MPDLVGRDALVLLRLLRRLALKDALGIGQALALLEEFLFELRCLLCVVLVDQCLDRSLVIGLRVRERSLDRLRDLDLRV
ncbi:MAG: hypothetical protein AB7O64_19070 [Methylibium sp.]